MSTMTEQNTYSAPASPGLRVVILTILAVITAVVAVSFAAHHLRITFEEEYQQQLKEKTLGLATQYSMAINGDLLGQDPTAAQSRYSSLLPALIVNSGDVEQGNEIVGQSVKRYALYTYTNGSLSPLYQSNKDAEFLGIKIPLSEWLDASSAVHSISQGGNFVVLSPIKDSQGKVVGVFELVSDYTFIGELGNKLEKRVFLTAALVSFAGLILFTIQFAIPKLISRLKKRGEF